MATGTPRGGTRPTDFKIPIFRLLLLEKLPFVALAAAASVVTFAVQSHGGAVATMETLPLGARLGNALISDRRYLGKIFWPTDLAIFYPHPGSWPLATVLLAAVFLSAVSVLFFVQRKRHPYLLVGWLWFLGTLVPVIGLVQVGGQSMADRYTYIPSIGLLVLIVWGAAEIWSATEGNEGNEGKNARIGTLKCSSRREEAPFEIGKVRASSRRLLRGSLSAGGGGGPRPLLPVDPATTRLLAKQRNRVPARDRGYEKQRFGPQQPWPCRSSIRARWTRPSNDFRQALPLKHARHAGLLHNNLGYRPAGPRPDRRGRRIHTKIKVGAVSSEQFREILRRVAAERRIPFDPTVPDALIDFIQNILKHELRACYPRDIVNQACWAARYEDTKPYLVSRHPQAGRGSVFPRGRLGPVNTTGADGVASENRLPSPPSR